MSRSQVEFLHHILDETQYLIRSSERLSKEDFLLNEDLKRAFTRSIEIIGEASKNVSEEIRNNYSAIDWRGMGRFRLVELPADKPSFEMNPKIRITSSSLIG